MKQVPILHRFNFKVIAGLISMLFLVGIPFFFLFLHHHRNQLLETIEVSTTNMSRILTRQLEFSMLQEKRHELQPLVAGLSKGSDPQRIMILDPHGRVSFSSDQGLLGRNLSMDTDAGCRECHAGSELRHTITLSDGDGKPYYRTVNAIQNTPACFSCHDRQSAINGVLVMDFSLDAFQSQFDSSLYRILWMGGTMLVLTIAVLYVLMNHLVIRKLRKFADATEQVGRTTFRRISLPGSDEFTQLAESFNLMSGRLDAAMREIQQSKDYLESVINNIDDEIVVVDRNLRVVTANSSYLRHRETLRGKAGSADRVRPEEQQISEGGAGLSEISASAQTFRDGKVHRVLQTLLREDGKEMSVEAISSPIKDSSGEVSLVIEVRRDITERKLLEANLAHSERLVSMGLLASGLAHEINNPLGSISTFIEGLKRRLERREDGKVPDLHGLDRSLGMILHEIERAKEVTQRLLILAQKKESGTSLVNLNESLLDTASLIRYEASRNGIKIEVDQDAEMPTINVSESQLRQVFLNLLLNSLQAGHSGGHVWCRTWHEDGHVFASVADDGTGIESEDMIRIFEPFYSKKATGQGTGLGLFICKSIVSAMGGEILVESSAGKGARFTVSLPVRS